MPDKNKRFLLYEDFGAFGKSQQGERKRPKSKDPPFDVQTLAYENHQFDDFNPGPDDRKLFMHQVIGEKGLLTRAACRRMARGFKKIKKKAPNAYTVVSIMGYEDDPRELFQIPEAAAYIRMFAELTGLDDLNTAMQQISEDSIRVFAACQVYGPMNVNVVSAEQAWKLQEESLHNWQAKLPKDN